MIVKFDNVPGTNFTSLLTFIHSDENEELVVPQCYKVKIVRVKSVTPDNQPGGTFYGLTLEILEWVPNGSEPGQKQVDPKYLLKVYEIIGKDRQNECVSNGDTPPSA